MPLALSVAVPCSTAMAWPTLAALPSICSTDSGSPSTSVSLLSTLIVMAVSSGVVAESSTATGASLAPVTVRVSVVTEVAPVGSVTV